MKTDPLFYRLFQEYPATAFELTGSAVPEGCKYVLHAEELKQTAQRIDGVLLPDCDRLDAPLVFTEAQFYADHGFYRRWLSAIFLYIHRHEVVRPWWAVVVFPHRATDVAVIAPFEGLVRSGQLRRVYLEDLLEETLDTSTELQLGRSLARLVVLDRERTAAEARALIEATAHFNLPERYPFVDLIETIVVYKLTELSREEIQQMLHLPETDLKKTRFYQDVFSEGRMEEALNLVLRLLNRRIGGVAEAQESRVRALTTERLEELGEALLDFQSADDLKTWLDAH